LPKAEEEDFKLKTENFSGRRKGEKEYLDDLKTRDLIKKLD